MKLQSLKLRNSLLVFAVLLLLGAPRATAQATADASTSFAQTSAVPARITQAIDETQLVRLRGNVHPLARLEFDQGAVADWQPMNRMLLVLQRSPEQQAALSKFMEEQQSKDSPNFHKWLTPQEFGAQFGPADADIQTVTDWLARQGFQRIKVGAGRTTIEFSGTVGQVRNAFHTEIHWYQVNGETRQANSADPQIPAALTPVVAGIVTLHNFPRKSMKHDAGAFVRTKDGIVKPLFTTTRGCGTSGTQPCYVVGPADFAKIYNVPTTLDGTGVTIAIVGASNINPQDVVDFRNLFGLPANFTSSNIILNGPDPGKNGAEGEADLDVQIAGMVAPKATIDLVVSESTTTAADIDLSALYIIDNNTAPVMSESFGVCEQGLGTAGNQFYNTLWEQAAAQGITVMVAAGDPGSAGCDDFTTQPTATHGLAVSGIASTPFNVAVGGTDFDDVGTQVTGGFWSATNGTGKESAQGYIKETTWNDSCAAAATSANLNTVCASANNIVAASGGPSSIYAKPSWQSGGVTPNDSHRDLPDVSLFASDGLQTNSFYLFCEADAISAGSPASCAPSGPFSFFGAGGTSTSSPAFAGIMALINQANGRQGNPNPVLYKIAGTSGQSCNSTTTPLTGSPTCSFYDITKGNNSVPCSGGTLNCSSTTAGTNGVLFTTIGTTKTPAFTTTTGYDLATGLGSVNVTNLATQWPLTVGTFHATTTGTKINGATTPVTITHGQSVTLSATVTSTSGTPTGDVSFLAPTSVNGGIGAATLSGGTATLATTFLPGSSGSTGNTYNVKAHYAGDGTFAPSDDPTGVPVVVNKENSRLQYGIVTFNPTTDAIVSTNATSFAYGSPYILRIDILNSTANACQLLVAPTTSTGCALDATGTVTITDSVNGAAPAPLDTGTFAINNLGHAEDQPIQLSAGMHALSATYSGDISYNAVNTPVTDTVTVSKAATATGVAPSPTSGVTTATPVTLTATISSNSNSAAGPSGTVTFLDGGTQIGSPAPVAPAGATSTAFAGGTASLTNTFTNTGTHTITATYSGDTNYATSNATAITVTVNSPGSFTVSGAAATVTAGSSGMSTITVTPSGGFTGPVTISCPTLPAGVTASPNCAASPSAFTVTVPSSGNGTGTLTLNVAAPSPTTSASLLPAERTLYAAGLMPARGGKGWWLLSAGAGLSAILLLLLPERKRYRAALGLGLICLLSFTLGCNGGYGGGGGGIATTTTKISVASTKVASGTSIAFTVTVTSTGRAPAGMVQLYDGTSTLGTATAVSSGTATINVSSLAVGTHGISAHYVGDTYTQASQSGTLSMAITGSTTVNITGTSGSATATGTVNLTIN
jgi:subtilase family serine protease